MHNGVPNDAALAAVLVFALFAAVLADVAERTRFFQRAVRWIQKDPVVRTALVVLLLAIGPITARTKNGQMSLPRPPLLLQVMEPPPEPAIAPVSVWTNGVALRAESTNAVEVTAFRTVGGTELGDWIETAAPFFAIGTNPVSRCYVSASGSVSFETMRRPPVGSALPDGTGLPVLCPLRAHLGMVPEANWTNANAQSRFWHDSLPGGGRVLTWENALVDRLPGRRVTLQVEMRPSGDSVFRYDFQDALNPPPTNFVMGAQTGTNGVNALSILGTNTLAATVWNVDGAPVTNGVSIADLLCTNGVLRTPATFEIRWKNTTGLAPEADTDNDGLTDWAETFVWGTAPDHADTDGDGRDDGIEIEWGNDPFDADEDGDGVPDGTSAADWAANTLWASNATNTAHSITVTLNSAVPAGTSASLMVGGLCIPLRSPSSWTLGLVPGELYPYRLVVGGDSPVDLSIGPGETAPPMRGGGTASPAGPPLWENGQGSVFDGGSAGGSGNMAVPTLNLVWIPESGSASHDSSSGVCIHGDGEALFSWDVAPAELKTAVEHLQLENLCESHQYLALSVDAQHRYVEGLAAIPRGHLRFGRVCEIVSAHLCDSSYTNRHCSICGAYDFIYAEGHDIEYLTILPDDDGIVRSEVHFPGEQTRNFIESSSPVPDLHQPLFFEDVQSLLEEPPLGVEHMIAVNAVAHMNPTDEPPENDVCNWRNLRGLSSPLPELEWENTAMFNVPLHGGVFKFRFQCTGFNDSDCFLVLPLAGASVDSVIASEISAADAFAARVRAKYPGWFARNSRENGLKWFVNYGAGDFRGRPDSHASPTVWYYNQVNDRSNFGAIATWGGKCVRLTKVSNFIDAYACQKIGVTALNQSIAQMIGTRNSVSGTTSWDCGVELANGTMTLAECAEWIATSCWNEGDEKVRRLWPNLAPADNFVEPGLFSNPNIQFTIPGFLRMTDP